MCAISCHFLQYEQNTPHESSFAPMAMIMGADNTNHNRSSKLVK